jgi:hypothetical protein
MERKGRITRRLFLSALLLAPASIHRLWALQSDARFLRAVAAVYRMLQATGTVSEPARPGLAAVTPAGSYSAVSLAVPRARPVRIYRDEFADLARQHPLRGVTREDREALDRALWTYVDAHSSLADALHLNEQWGPEGESLARSRAENVAHVEGCRQCRGAYLSVVRDTRLTCGSAALRQNRNAGAAAKRETTTHQGSTIPP